MFTKPTKPGARAESGDAALPRKPVAMSLIAENVRITGDLASEGDVQLDGAVHGDVRVARLSIGETGQVEGAIMAEAVEVRGRVTGAIRATNVRLHATAQVEGDISHLQLAMDAGAQFTGRSVRLDAEPGQQLRLPIAAE